MSFKSSVTIVTTRRQVERGEVKNLTSLDKRNLDGFRKNGDYIVILQEIVDDDNVIVDRITYHGGSEQKWEQKDIKVFYSLKDVEVFLNGFYRWERFIINALPEGRAKNLLSEFIQTMD